VKDSSYFDVQCESCHGPGLPHVEDPATVKPLASIAIDSILDAATNGCGECHVGEHHPFVEQWAESKHGYGGEAYIEEGGNATCAPCHEGRTAIASKMGVQSNYLEKDIAGAAGYQPIVCSVCHDPHSKANDGQLRRSISAPTRDNLCVSCHSRQGAPGTSTRRGPHAAQGLLVIDESVGWLPPGFAYDTGSIAGSHGTEANPRLCASCHVQFKTITDASNNFLLQSVGHLFEAIPCTDANGEPVPGPCTEDQRDFSACAVSGCHGSVEGAKIAFDVVKDRLNGLTDALWADDGDARMETTDGGLLPKILAQSVGANRLNEMNLYKAPLTPAEGAIWNAQLAFTHDREYWSGFTIAGQYSCSAANCTASDSLNTAHKSSGEGAHNPFLLEALLLSSINYLQTYYNVLAPPVDLTPRLKAPPGLRTE
jgi:predicted CXXCH cytochrome family protein